jgi:hypothetical protein
MPVALELIYTSAPRGLKPGSSGFCTVAATAGMPAPLAAQLEALSAYRPAYRAGAADASRNPVSTAHYRIRVGGRFVSVLSRVQFAGVDYSRRSNKLAHHLALDAGDQSPAGPAWLAQQAGLFVAAWDEEPRRIAQPRTLPRGELPARVCEAWATATGDAGWAGVLVERLLLDATRPVYLIVPPMIDLLPLFAEATALLPAAARWRATFNTYTSQIDGGPPVAWRGCLAGTPAADAAARAGDGLVLDLTTDLDPAPAGRYVAFARTGTPPAEPEPELDDPEPPVEWPAEASAPVAVAHDDEPLPVRTAPAGERPATLSPVFWLVALGWPIVALSLGLILYRSTTPAAPDADAAHAALAAELDRLQQRHAELSRENERLRAALAAQPAAALGAPRATAPVAADEPAASPRPVPPAEPPAEPPGDRRIVGARSPVARPLPAPADDPLIDTTDTAPDRPRTAEPIGRMLDPVGNRWIAPLPELIHGSLGFSARKVPLLDGLPPRTAVTLNPPGIELDYVEFRNASGRGRVVLQPSPTRGYEVARVQVLDGVLWWDWRRPAGLMGLTEELRELDRLVQRSTLTIDAGGAPARVVQLREPEPAVLATTDLPAQVAVSWHLDAVQLEPVAYPQGWTVAASVAGDALVAQSANGLTLIISVADGSLAADWRDGPPAQAVQHARVAVEGAQFDYDTIAARHRVEMDDLERDIEFIRQDLRRTDRPDTIARLEGRLDRALAARDELERQYRDAADRLDAARAAQTVAIQQQQDARAFTRLEARAVDRGSNAWLAVLTVAGPQAARTEGDS